MSLFRQVTVCQNVAMIFFKHPVWFVFGLVVGLFSGCAWFIGSEDANLPRFPKSRRFFSSFGDVVEITNGSMEHLTSLLEEHDFSFILFYAPWSGKSWKVAQQFNKAAKMLGSEVSFVAMNCWIGTCSQQNKVDLFPKLVAIHTVFDGIEYKGTYRALKMVGFMHSIMRPFVHIGTHAELTLLKKSNQELVIGYFNQTALNSRNYSTFFNLTLQFISEVSKPTFAVVTNPELAFQTGVKHMSGVAYHRINQPVLIYPSLRSFTVTALLSWIEANRCELVTHLTPRFAGKDHITRHLAKGPALILFLPIKQHVAPENLQLSHTYLQVASQYFNCSCNRTSTVTTSSAAVVSNVTTKDTKETSREVKLEDIVSNTTHLTRLFDNEVDIIMGAKGMVLPSFLGKRHSGNVETCRTIRVQREHESKRNKLSICDVCHICPLESCIQERRIEVLNMEARALALTNSCSTIKPSYYSRATITSICCTVRNADGTNHLSPLGGFETVSLKSLRELEKGWDNFFTDILDSITKSFGSEIFQDNAKPNSEQNVLDNKPERRQQDSSKGGASSSPLPFPQDKSTVSNEASSVQVANNTCVRSGHVTEFLGAGCHSNRSVNFFIMDSTECWTIAEKLGVRRSDKAQVALLIADLENEAQFVLDESLNITNSSVVDFVMGYMAGNLTRRFRSGRPAPRECPSFYACVTEVVTSTFEDIVLDETKDVLLVYYAPWCGFCQALGPVLLTVAKYFQDASDVTIARINVDENDLPWELHVTHLPSFILFPAHRKDFSVPFPDALERTAANLVQFVFEHRGRTTEIAEEHCLPEGVKEKIHELGATLRQVEEEKRTMEVVLGEAVRAKDLWKHKQAIAAKGLKHVEQELANEREMRLEAKMYTRSLEKKQKETEEKVLRLVAGSGRILSDLQAAQVRLKQKEKQLSLLTKENRRILLGKDELLGQLREKESILEGQRKTVLELHNLVTALRRRVTHLEFSNNALRLKLRNTHSEYLHTRNMFSSEIQNSETLDEATDENEKDPTDSLTEHDFSDVQN